MPTPDYHHVNADPQSLHRNLPTVNMDEDDLGRGWRKPAHGEVIQTCWQAYAFAPRPGWRISTFWSEEGAIHVGACNYRAPASLRAWLTVLPALIAKVWHRYVVNRGRIY